MFERFSVRVAPLTTRAAQYGPVAPACCNACRTCTTTNLVGLVLGGATVAALAVGRLGRRIAGRS
jgi:hypothetical protein